MDRAQDNSVKQCIEVLLKGGIAVIPTDTVYGLVCRAIDKKAVKRLYSIKQRTTNPGPIISAAIEQLISLGIKRRYLKAVEHFWPNPISIEIPHDLDYLNLGTGRQAMRVVKGKKLVDFLKQTGPLLTTSANSSGEPPAKNIAAAKKYFAEDIDYYLDGGEIDAVPSTLISIEDDVVNVIRQGAVKINANGEIEK